MNVLDRIRRLFGGRNRAVGSDLPGTWVEAFGGRSSSAPLNEATALNISAVFRAVTLLSDAIKAVPIPVYQKGESSAKTPAPQTAGHRIINVAPNARMRPSRFKKLLTSWTLLWGNGYAEIVRKRGDGMPVEVWPIHPSRVRAEQNKRDGSTIWVVTDANGQTKRIADANMLHIMGLSRDGICGMSVVAAARQSLSLAYEAERYGNAFLRNDARPGTLLKHPAQLSEDARRNLSESWKKMHGGDNKGGLAILEEGLEVAGNTAGMSNEDAQFLETREFQVVEIARWFGVPPHKLMDLSRATFCLPAGTSVFTVDGPKPIESISCGEQVWSYDGSQIVSATVEKAGHSGRDEILRIAARGAVLRCNGAHRVLVRRECLRPVRGRGGVVTNPDGSRWRRSWQEQYVRADEILPGDKLVAPLGVPTNGCRTLPNGRIADVSFCETAGHHLGDGFFLATRGYSSGFGFSHAASESSRDYYADAARSVFGERSDPYGRDSILSRPVSAKLRDANTTVIYNSAAARELEELGFGGTAHTKTLPSWVYRLPRELRIATLRGYLDSDGHVNKAGQARFASVSRALIESFRHLAISVGFSTSRIGSSVTTNTFGGKTHRLYVFGINNPNHVQEIGTHKPEYAARVDAVLRRKRVRNVAVYANESRRRGLDRPSIRYLPIMDVVREPAEDVYDLSVSGTHSFVADGVIVHNSNIEHQAIEYVGDGIMPWSIEWEEECDLKLLSADEREHGYFFESNLDGLLRADIKTRYEAYSIGRQWGWVNVNEIRARENMNPIGDEGDVYLVPVNMEPASLTLERAERGLVDDAPPDGNNAPRGVPPTQDDEEDDPAANAVPQRPTRELVVEAHVRPMADAIGRMLRKETKAADKRTQTMGKAEFTAWMDGWFADHRGVVWSAIRPSMESLAICLGIPDPAECEQVAEATTEATEQHVAKSKELLLAAWPPWDDSRAECDARGYLNMLAADVEIT